jgi:hypothetical protein
MKPSDQKIDASMQAYAKRWLKSLDRPRPSTTLGYFFAGLFILFWSSSLTTLLGFDLKKGWGSLVFLGVALLLTLLTLVFIRLMAILGLDRPMRSALLFSAVMGPYAYMAAYHALNQPVVSHVIGFIASILAFLASLMLDRLLSKATHKTDKV